MRQQLKTFARILVLKIVDNDGEKAVKKAVDEKEVLLVIRL